MSSTKREVPEAPLPSSALGLGPDIVLSILVLPQWIIIDFGNWLL